ncbi:hypothetical protein FCE95_12035 [Luteimonas gilva]|uniref:Uncharacterized protein n=1 Tax=Luteimonas gilva TaxID=2572684 RepID=A0A4U5JQS5_9GAMM|nr:hypothetical protein [Luteimonas gilva]TKR30818.1 hypothetical protein FCE95_12035 [Luteimonas gilva]
MPDVYSQREPSPGWDEAFAALPAETPPGDGWARLSARLDARRKPRWVQRFAIAAAVTAAVALPWSLRDRLASTEQAAATVATATVPEQAEAAQGEPKLEQLYAESARLEALLQYARDDRVSSASAAALSSEMDARIATIDRALMRPGLSPEQQLWLWRSRVDALRSQAGFESTRRWLAANGERYDGAVARVD